MAPARRWPTISLILLLAGATASAKPSIREKGDAFMSACRMAVKMKLTLQDAEYLRRSQVGLGVIKATADIIQLNAKVMEHIRTELGSEMPAELLNECTNIMRQETSIKVNRSYLSESGRFAQGIVTYTNHNKRTIAEARVRCDAMAHLDKVGTEEVPVTGPILSQAERTLDFMIPLAGGHFDHLECLVTLER
jgi:hypothetical protein